MTARTESKKTRKKFANHEIVVLAVYLAGGQFSHVDLEDIAVKTNEIAPGRFAWKKYKDQINIDIINKRLWDAMKPDKGGYLIGSQKDGWLLTVAGVQFAERHISDLDNLDLSRTRLEPREETWAAREKQRLLAEEAFRKFDAGQFERVSAQEAERFFRLDDYVLGKARHVRIQRIINFFADDIVLGGAVRALAAKVREK